MLDTTTKKRIDDCRDILVGKLPDPKAQIEQITIGLIYKFMDDMDKESIELGGTAKFFSDGYEKYSWDSLFDSKVSAVEMLGLYSEAIVSMDKNPNIPGLFRDIFKNAFLPYRDPETLKLFLKTIGEFEYTHSEKLGDAFEYLLSVMGSQGDAGQFRTPRHIIDFLVEAVDPDVSDTILDPACGTAGFLISAFKYIKEKNNNELTPDQRKKLINNFAGYDISPDMVRLSLVNLYLHGFSDPHIVEYDTLTSDDRWDDGFDVVLANPPFMSPKGGIRPHKRFSVSSNRSEVLFVDYIAEHLNPKGRAGIIVPEGVIFQSGKAYKALRKMLVENYLYAVVSLPAGVFNPYSGVKTSILLMNKELAKKCDEVLFVKIDNDGYNLGAQRNAVKGGQLGDVCFVKAGGTPSRNNSKYWEGSIPWYSSGELNDIYTKDSKEFITEQGLNNSNTSLFPKGSLLIGMYDTAAFKMSILDREGTFNQAVCGIKPNEQFNLLFLLIYFLMNKEEYLRHRVGVRQRNLNKGFISALKIPLIPLEIQLEIVTKLEKEQDLVNANKKLIEIFEQKIKDRIGRVWGGRKVISTERMLI